MNAVNFRKKLQKQDKDWQYIKCKIRNKNTWELAYKLPKYRLIDAVNLKQSDMKSAKFNNTLDGALFKEHALILKTFKQTSKKLWIL